MKSSSRTSLNGLKFGLGLSFAGPQKGKGSGLSSGVTPGTHRGLRAGSMIPLPIGYRLETFLEDVLIPW
jgi:hypothetical protein